MQSVLGYRFLPKFLHPLTCRICGESLGITASKEKEVGNWATKHSQYVCSKNCGRKWDELSKHFKIAIPNALKIIKTQKSEIKEEIPHETEEFVPIFKAYSTLITGGCYKSTYIGNSYEPRCSLSAYWTNDENKSSNLLPNLLEPTVHIHPQTHPVFQDPVFTQVKNQTVYFSGKIDESQTHSKKSKKHVVYDKAFEKLIMAQNEKLKRTQRNF